MGSKSSAPAAPDYTPIALADENAAKIAQQTSQQQLDWAKQQYADQAPVTNAYLQSMTANSNAQTANAQQAEQRYQSIYQPVEDQFVKQATGWNSPARAAQEAGAAEADVSNQFAGQRQAALSSLEGYGIDPSQTRFAALDLGTRVSQAAATAAAGTQSRKNTEATGLALEGEAINIGKGYPGQVAQSYAGATTAGGAGVTAGLNTSSTYGSLMGTPSSWANTAAAGRSSAVGALNTGFQDQMGSYSAETQAAGNTMSGIGSLVGSGVAIGAIAI